MIAVLGVNGTGTSAVTRLLHRLGVPFPGPYDCHRNMENKAVRGLNDMVIAAVTSHPDVGPLLVDQIPDYVAVTCLSPIRRGPTINWKDPKGCLTLPCWRHLIDRVVRVYRSPASIARNLWREYQIGRREAYGIIEAYDAHLTAALVEHAIPSYPIAYEDLWLRRDDEVVREVLDFCGAERPEDNRVIEALVAVGPPRYRALEEEMAG